MTQTISRETIYANRTKWSTELREGRREQAHEVLANPEYTAFCCLGVYADICPSMRRVSLEDADRCPGSFYLGDDVAEARLPAAIRVELGLTPVMEDFLIALNDDAELPFSVIALVIDRLPIVDTSEWNKQKFLRRNIDLFAGAKPEWLYNELAAALASLPLPV